MAEEQTSAPTPDADILSGEPLARLALLYEYKDLLKRAQRRGAEASFVSETYSRLLAAFSLRAENFKHADRLVEAALTRAVLEAHNELAGFSVGDEVLVHRSRVGRIRNIRNGLIYVAHDDGRRPPSTNNLTHNNVIRLETARAHHVHGRYARTVYETRPFRVVEVDKAYAEMERNEFLSFLPAMPHICPSCAELMRAAYQSRFVGESAESA